MLKERIFIGIVAVLLGVGFAAGVFYLWQSTKIIPKAPKTLEETPKPTVAPTQALLTIDSPIDESVIDKRIIPVLGKAIGAKLVIVSTNTQDFVLKPGGDGSFSTNVTLGTGASTITIVSVTPSGEHITQTKTVTFSTETF